MVLDEFLNIAEPSTAPGTATPKRGELQHCLSARSQYWRMNE
jgi:hypothetical protein